MKYTWPIEEHIYNLGILSDDVEIAWSVYVMLHHMTPLNNWLQTLVPFNIPRYETRWLSLLNMDEVLDR